MRVLSFRLALLFLLGLAALPAGVARGGDEDPMPANPPGADGKPGEEPAPNDEADDKVSFVEEVNRAIEQGVLWLKAKPEIGNIRDSDVFPVTDVEMAHWGLIHGSQLYDPTATGPEYRHPAGVTALALYTLLKCGVDPKDPVIEKGFLWLRTAHDITEKWDAMDGQGHSWCHTEAGSSYELSAMLLALTAKYDHYKRGKNSAVAVKRGRLKITDKEDREWMQALVTELVARRGQPETNPTPSARSGWRYNVPILNLSRSVGRGTNTLKRESKAAPHANQDLSSTQLAAMALYSAQRFGAKADPDVWFEIVNYVLSHQETEGPERVRKDPVYSAGGYAAPKDHARGFMYIKGSPDRSEGIATGSMTACGVATLLMAKDVLCENEKTRKQWMDAGLDKKVETAVWDGLAWMDLHWSPFSNPNSQYGYPIYYLYALERAMDILGKNLVGSHLWYTEGAQQILKVQKRARVIEKMKKGSREVDGAFWETGQTHDPKDVLDTCFALLFLKRATKDLVPPAAVTGGDGAPADNR